MGHVVLCPLPRQPDYVTVELVPAESSDLLAPGPSKDQQLIDRAERPRHFTCCAPYQRELRVIQFAISLGQLPLARQIGHRVYFQDVATDRPPEQSVQMAV